MQDNAPSGGSNGMPTVSSLHYASPDDEAEKPKKRKKKRDENESGAAASTDPSDYKGYEPRDFLNRVF